MPLSPEEIGKRIARARETKEPKSWSQFDLAIALGVSPSTVYRWEKGKLPSVNELMRLAEVLEQPHDYFLEPPERQTTLSAIEQQVADLHELLESRRAGDDRVREALLETLASIHDRLLRIERQLGIPTDQENSDAAENHSR